MSLIVPAGDGVPRMGACWHSVAIHRRPAGCDPMNRIIAIVPGSSAACYTIDGFLFCSSRGVGCMAVPLPWSMKPSRRRCRVAVRSGQGPRLRGRACAQLCPD